MYGLKMCLGEEMFPRGHRSESEWVSLKYCFILSVVLSVELGPSPYQTMPNH